MKDDIGQGDYFRNGEVVQGKMALGAYMATKQRIPQMMTVQAEAWAAVGEQQKVVQRVHHDHG